MLGKCYKVIAPNISLLHEADSIIISTWKYRLEVINELKSIGVGEKIIDIYADGKIDLSKPFYVDECHNRYWCNQ